MGRGPRPGVGRPLKILLVEDNPDDAEITRRAAMRVLPCEVEVIHDGATAIAALTRGPGPARTRPDLILLDLHLPALSGLDVLRQVRIEPAYDLTPVVVLTTASDDEETILECYASGANSFLTKPATGERFAEALKVLAGGAGPVPARPLQ